MIRQPQPEQCWSSVRGAEDEEEEVGDEEDWEGKEKAEEEVEDG